MCGIQNVLGSISSSGKRKPVWGRGRRRGRKRGREKKERREEERGGEGEGKEETKEREGKRKVREKLDKNPQTVNTLYITTSQAHPTHQEHIILAPYTCSLIIPLEVKIKTRTVASNSAIHQIL